MNSDLTVEMPREIVSASTTAQTGELHFKADSVSSTTDTTFYIFYNGVADDYASTSEYGSQNVWTNDYYMVHHLNEGASVVDDHYKDSTQNNLHGTLYDADTDTADESAGRVGNALNFNGDSDQILIQGFSAPATGTVSVWLKRDEVGVADIVYGAGSNYELSLIHI